MPYSEGFRAQVIRKLATPGGPSATALAKEIGIPQSTLSRWLRRAGTFGETLASTSTPKERPMTAKRPQDWSAEEKLAVVVEAAAIAESELGAFLRARGLHQAQVQEWRQRLLSSLSGNTPAGGKTSPADARRIRELERELARKDKALAETAALLMLKKKAQAIWGDEDAPTPAKNGSK